VIRHAETPLLRTAPVPLYLLSRRVRESGFKVVLTGEGGDEVFGGYNIFREAKVRRFWARQRGSAWRPRLLARLYPYVFRDAKSRAMIPSFFGRGLDAPDAPFFSHRIRWENTGRLRRLFSDDLGAATRSYDRYGDLLQSLPAGYGQWDYLARAQYLEVILFLGGYLLSSQGDRVAMAHSVEARMPYLDHRLVELAARMPARWKIRGLTEKYVLKKAFEGVVPDRIRERSKHPFRAPIRDALLKGEAAAASLDMLSAAALKNAGLFDAAKVPRLVERMRRAEAPGELDDMALAGILSAQWVHRHFVEDFRSWSAAGTGRLPPCPVVDRRTGPLRGRGKR